MALVPTFFAPDRQIVVCESVTKFLDRRRHLRTMPRRSQLVYSAMGSAEYCMALLLLQRGVSGIPHQARQAPTAQDLELRPSECPSQVFGRPPSMNKEPSAITTFAQKFFEAENVA